MFVFVYVCLSIHPFTHTHTSIQPNSTEPAFQQLFNNSKIGIIYLKPGILLNSRYAISSLDLDNNSIGPIK